MIKQPQNVPDRICYSRIWSPSDHKWIKTRFREFLFLYWAHFYITTKLGSGFRCSNLTWKFIVQVWHWTTELIRAVYQFNWERASSNLNATNKFFYSIKPIWVFFWILSHINSVGENPYKVHLLKLKRFWIDLLLNFTIVMT